MNHPVFRAVLRQQWMMLMRDRRLLIATAALLVACITAVAGGSARNQRLEMERQAAMRADAEAWRQQGVVNPHGAAHFGHYVVRPVAVASAFDPGLLDHLGTLVRLEAHRQHPASVRPSDGGTALNRFATFSAASALQGVAPLLVILIGFGAFSGERARALLQQELAAGVNPQVLLLGRLVGLGAIVGIMLALFLGVGAVLLLFAGSGADGLLTLLFSTTGYALYLFAFLALTLAASLLCRSARSALASLLAIWVLVVWIVPVATPGIVAAVHPTPTGPELEEQVANTVDAGLDDGGSRETRPERLKERILRKYGVDSVDALPVNLSGALLEYTEESSTRAYQAYFDRLHETYRRQQALERWFAIASPLVALKAWSAALAGTDFEAHRRFLVDAERYRYAFVQQLNRDIALHRTQGSSPYVANVARLTASVDRFESRAEPIAAIVRRQAVDLAILVGWFAASVSLAFWSARRLRSNP